MSVRFQEHLRTVPWTGGNALIIFLLPWVILPIIFYFWLGILAPFIPAAETYINALDSGDPIASLGLVAVDALGSLGIIVFYLHRYRTGVGSLGIRSFSIGKFIWYVFLVFVAFGILLTLAYVALEALDPGFNAEQEQTTEFDGAPLSIGLIALVILPPIVEETVFRGVMFPAFAKRFGVALGAVLSSILFGLAHFQPNVVVYTFILGLLLCFLYTKLGSIIPGIAVHTINNYLAYTASNQ